MIAGVYLIYEGSIALTTTARGESLYLVGMMIPAKNSSLYPFGSLCVALGAILLASPFLFKKLIK